VSQQRVAEAEAEKARQAAAQAEARRAASRTIAFAAELDLAERDSARG